MNNVTLSRSKSKPQPLKISQQSNSHPTTLNESRFILKRSKFDRNVYYLEPRLPKTKKSQTIIKKSEHEPKYQEDKLAFQKTEASIKDAFAQPEPINREFDFDEYIGNMKSCIFSQHKTFCKGSVSNKDLRDNPPEKSHMFLRLKFKDLTPSISKKQIKRNCPLSKIQQGLFLSQPLYQPNEKSTNPYDLIEDQRFTLFKLNTLFLDYIQLECVSRLGKIYSINANNQAQTKFQLNELDQALTRPTSLIQPIYTRLSKYNLNTHQQFVLAVPLVYSNIAQLHNSLHYFMEMVKGDRVEEGLAKRLWVRDKKGRLSFVEVRGLLGEWADGNALKAIREEIDRVNQARRRGLHCGLSKFVYR